MKILDNSRAASNESQTNLFLPSKFLCTFYRLFYNKQQMMKGPCSYLFSVYYLLKSPKYPFIVLVLMLILCLYVYYQLSEVRGGNGC